MKALFFLLDGESNASSYYRVVQYLPLLRQHGIEPTLSRPVPRALYERLTERGDARLQHKLGFYGTFLLLRALSVQRAHRYDVVVIQRDLFPFGPPWLEQRLFRVNPRLVYDVDDATYLRPSFTPDTVFQRLRRFDKVADVARHSRWVSAATEAIASWMRRFNSRVDVVPMALDLAPFRAVRCPPRAEHDPVVVGWTGTAGGLRYLHALAPVLRRLADQYPLVVRVVSGGYRNVCLPGVPLDARPWRAESLAADIASFHIGLVPLDDTEFERAKFPMKLLQYMAASLPAVATRFDTTSAVVTDAESGLLVSTQDEWQDALEALIRDAALRRRLGNAGHEVVAQRFTIERVAPKLIAGLYSAAAA